MGALGVEDEMEWGNQTMAFNLDLALAPALALTPAPTFDFLLTLVRGVLRLAFDLSTRFQTHLKLYKLP